MSDETFRPRKPIDPSEVNAPNDPLEGVRKVQQQMASEAGKDFEGPLGEGAGFQTKGAMPEAFRRELEKNRSQAQQEFSPPQQSAPQPIRPREAQTSKKQFDDNPIVQANGNADLERLLAGLQDKTQNYEEIELPSRGVFYNGTDGPMDGILHVRTMTGEEQEILATPRYVKKNLALDMIFKNCIRENYNPVNLLSEDRTYLLIWLRGISYSPEYEVEVKCPTTDYKFNTTIDLSELNVEYCPDDFGPDNLNDVLPSSGYKFKYRYPTGKDDLHLGEYRERQISMWGEKAADDIFHYRSAHLIDNIEGMTDKKKLMTLLKKLPINDTNYIRTTLSEPPFGVDTKVKIYSPYAIEEFTVDLPLDVSFFLPGQKKKKMEQ